MPTGLKRVVVGTLGIILILLLIILKIYHFLPFVLFVGGISFLGTLEMLDILKQKWVSEHKLILLVFSLLVPAFFYLYTFFPSFPFLIFSIFAGFVAFFIPHIFKSNFFESITYITHYFFGLFFIVFSLSFFILIINKDFGLYYIAVLFLTVWMNDTFAYVAGITVFRSKRHLIPLKVSPKKSYEGYISGLLFGVLAVFLANFIFSRGFFYESKWFEINFSVQTFSFWKSILIGVVLVVSADLGDLFESVIKRSVNIKDSGNILPGHGGILDRFDSFLIAGPVYYFLLIFLGK